MLICLAGLAAACAPADPEAELTGLIASAEQAAEARDSGFFRDLISERYADVRGYDRGRLSAMIRGYFLAHAELEVATRLETVVLNGADAAELTLLAGVLGQRETSIFGGLDGELWRVELELVKEGGEWRVIGARWERSLEGGLF